MTKKIGFACKWIDNPTQVDGIKPTDDCKQYNTNTTTVAWLNRQTRDVAEQKLWNIMVNNIESTRKLVERVGTLDDSLRMVRLSSGDSDAASYRMHTPVEWGLRVSIFPILPSISDLGGNRVKKSRNFTTNRIIMGASTITRLPC